MNIQNTSLGVFVPGQSTTALYLQTPFQGSLGRIGDFVPASFPIPQVPIKGGGMGQFMDACFPVPQNPIGDAANIVPAKAIGAGMSGVGCSSCAGSCGAGMGDLSTFVTNLGGGNWTDALMGNDFWTGIPNFVVIGVGAWLIGSLIGDTKRVAHRTRSAATTSRKALGKAIYGDFNS